MVTKYNLVSCTRNLQLSHFAQYNNLKKESSLVSFHEKKKKSITGSEQSH